MTTSTVIRLQIYLPAHSLVFFPTDISCTLCISGRPLIFIFFFSTPKCNASDVPWISVHHFYGHSFALLLTNPFLHLLPDGYIICSSYTEALYLYAHIPTLSLSIATFTYRLISSFSSRRVAAWESHTLSRLSTHTLMIINLCQWFAHLHFRLPTQSFACLPAFACLDIS